MMFIKMTAILSLHFGKIIFGNVSVFISQKKQWKLDVNCCHGAISRELLIFILNCQYKEVLKMGELSVKSSPPLKE